MILRARRRRRARVRQVTQAATAVSRDLSTGPSRIARLLWPLSVWLGYRTGFRDGYIEGRQSVLRATFSTIGGR